MSVTTTGTFSDKRAGTGKTVTFGTLSLTGDDAGNYQLASSGNQKTTTADITKKIVSVTGIQANDKTYDGTTNATFNYTDLNIDGKIGGDSLSVSATGAFENKNAGNGKPVNITNIALTGNDKDNYQLDATTGTSSATITPKQITSVNWSPSTLPYTGSPQAPTATLKSTDLVQGDSVNVSVGTDRESIAQGSYTATATGVDNPNYALSGTIEQKFTITKADPAYSAPSNLEANVGDTLSTIELPTDPNGTFTWSTPSTKLDTEGTNTYYVTYTPNDTTNYNTVYSIPVSVTANLTYWMAASNIENSEKQIYKSATQIKKDVEAIRAGNTTVINEYTNYMKNDNYHLYAKWNGSNQDNSGANTKNSYVEFRIIQVGEHMNRTSGSSDGSALTFQAVHTLPASYQMSTTSSVTGGWAGTTLYGLLQSGGSIYNSFNESFTNDIKQVEKPSYNGSSYSYPQCKFWILSHKEMTGGGDTRGVAPADEGTQYDYYSLKSVNAGNKNSVLALRTRAGNCPQGITNYTWWQRSLNISESSYFLSVDGEGVPYNTFSAAERYGVALAFCF